MKIAIVDLVRVLDESKAGLEGAQKVKAFFEQQEREAAPLIAHMKSRQGKPPDAQTKQAETRLRDMEGEREKLRASLREELLNKAKALMGKVAAENGIDFVLARPQAMLFARPELDLTQALIAALDA